jgi:hypothetical protein
MNLIQVLWLPIVLSSVFVFVVSAVIHMATPWHSGDYKKLPNQDPVMDALRPFSIPPGDYMVPRGEQMKDMRTPEFKERMAKGPVIVMTVFPTGMWGIGKNLVLWFIYLILISAFAAYMCYHTLPVGASTRNIIRVAGLTAFLGYAPALWQMTIWYRRSWGTTVKATIDGALFAAVTAATFAWLWPK